MQLSVVIPAYNEQARLPGTLHQACDYLHSHLPGQAEVLVVDDGSTDRTAELAAALPTADPPVRVLRHAPNRGKGYAVRSGLRAAVGEWALVSDADLSTPLTEYARLAAAAGPGIDGVIGSRALPDSRIERHQPWPRERLGKCFNAFLRAVLLPGYRDTQCGFKLFRTAAVRPLLSAARIDGFAWDVEILWLARRAGLRIREVPVHWHNSPASKVAPLRDGTRMALDVLRLRLRGGRREKE